MSYLPNDPKTIKLDYRLYTRANKDKEQHLYPDDPVGLSWTNFNASLPTKIISHGYLDVRYFAEWMLKMKNAFLAKDDYNVILFYWHSGNIKLYPQVVANTRVVGAELARMIIYICNSTGAQASSFHILGHSLSAHVSGYAGERLRGNMRIGRITALDAAGYMYDNMPPSVRLDPTDAMFVDVIHTDSRPVWQFLGMGSLQSSGHVDFWPNDGKNQPGCHSEKIRAIPKGAVELSRRLAGCSHMRSFDYFTESLVNKECKFVGMRCSDWHFFQEGSCGDCTVRGQCAEMGYKASNYEIYVKNNKSVNFYMNVKSGPGFYCCK